jgi:eukaryotic-like serine/threonine-protein kinase
MTTVDWAVVEPIVDAALDLPEAERAALVEQMSDGNAAIRDAALRWLRGCAKSDGFLDAPVVGTHIGPWRVLRELGRGGMGVVYLVERPDSELPLRAALKRLRDGGALDAHGVRRFREERRILAQLEHPGIARLLDGGVSADGTPWFAMEYVDGVPIDEWCRAQRLGVRERVRLVLRVLDAVQHAHARLVVHRDLKPSNVLVDNDGVPRLLDFGIAKLLLPDASTDAGALASTMTRADGAPMSLPFAAPEQVREEPVSTATDVYAMGVLLYELLTGALPYGEGHDGRVALEARILAGDALRPSQQLSGGAAVDAGLEPASVARALRGDLDLVVLRAMHREPARRYPSASAMADDLRAWLDGLPVSARPDSAWYRLQKFVARYPVATGAGAVLLVSLVAFAVSTARQARRLAIERENAEQVTQFLTETLSGTNLHTRGDSAPSLRELLDGGAARAARELSARPEVRGNLLAAIAPVYFALGEWQRQMAMLRQADEAYRAAWGADDVRRVLVVNELAQLEMRAGSPEAAERWLREGLRLLERTGEYRQLRRDALLVTLEAALMRQGRRSAVDSLRQLEGR